MILNKVSVSVLLTLALILNPAWAPLSRAQAADIPADTVIRLILDDRLSTETTEEGDRFSATVAEDVIVNGRTVIRHGADVDGTVTEVDEAERLAGLAGRASLTLRFDTIDTVYGVRPIRATLLSVHDPVVGVRGDDDDIDDIDDDDDIWGLEDDDDGDNDRDDSVSDEGEIEADTDTTGIITKGAIGVAAGALLGALFGNVSRGVLLGSIGGAIAILAPEGEDVELDEGTGLRIRLDQDIERTT